MAQSSGVGGLVDHFVAMARNNAWANHRPLSACEALTVEESAALRTGFSPSLHATLNHILDVDLHHVTALDKRLIAFWGRQTDASLAREQHLRRDELRALGLPET